MRLKGSDTTDDAAEEAMANEKWSVAAKPANNKRQPQKSRPASGARGAAKFSSQGKGNHKNKKFAVAKTSESN